MLEEKNKKFSFSFKILIVILLSAAIFGGSLIYAGVKVTGWAIDNYQDIRQKEKSFNFKNSISKLFKKPTLKEIQPIKIVSEESQVIDVVAKSSPAVVSIVATAEVPTFETYYNSPFSDLPDQFQQFFNFRVPQRRQNGTEKRRIGAGTGFLVSADGYIITNKHVVEDESAEYTVFLNDEKNKGEKIKAEVLARDPNHDLAVLKIDKKDLPFLEFSDSDSLKVGQTAITIGYALGEFDNTVSKGVISGLSRSIVAGKGFGLGSEELKNLIQTDAAINPGNSGGPMLDISGNVVGINVAMANGENIGFAVPGNYAKKAFDEVKKTGKIKKEEVAFLGVRYLAVTDALQTKNKLPYNYGALVVRGDTQEDLAVLPGSPADKAGLVENDIILEINGKKVTIKNQLSDLIRKYHPSDEITLKIYHKGEEKEIKVKLTKN